MRGDEGEEEFGRDSSHTYRNNQYYIYNGHHAMHLESAPGNPSPWGNGEIFPHAHRSASPCTFG